MLEEGLEPVTLTGVWLMHTDRPNVIVDITDEFDTKVASLACHVTQMPEGGGDADGMVSGLAAFVAKDEPFRYGEAFGVLRFDMFPDLSG